MSETPTQPFLVRLPSESARRIAGIVDQTSSGYESLAEFIRVAVENQLTLEEASEDKSTPADQGKRRPLASRSASGVLAPPVKRSKSSGVRRATPAVPKSAFSDYATLLARPVLGGMACRDRAAPSGGALSSFTNRLSPFLASPRALANLTTGGAPPSAELFADAAAKAARSLGFRLLTEDEASGRRGRQRRSTAWPVGDDESKSLIRFRNCFMFTGDARSGFTGPLLDLGLVVIVGGDVFLTETGASFARALVPAIDEPGGVDLLSIDHREILAHALVAIPNELVEIRHFLIAVEQSSGAQDEVDKRLDADHDWTEAQVVSHRAAMVGRLRDIQVVDVEVFPGGKAQIVPAAYFEDFSMLVNQAQEA